MTNLDLQLIQMLSRVKQIILSEGPNEINPYLLNDIFELLCTNEGKFSPPNSLDIEYILSMLNPLIISVERVNLFPNIDYFNYLIFRAQTMYRPQNENLFLSTLGGHRVL